MIVINYPSQNGDSSFHVLVSGHKESKVPWQDPQLIYFIEILALSPGKSAPLLGTRTVSPAEPRIASTGSTKSPSGLLEVM